MHLTVQNTSHRPSLSVDGETLRPRSCSFASSADTAVRSRAGSDVDHPKRNDQQKLIQQHVEPNNIFVFDETSLSEALKPGLRDEADFKVDGNRFAFSPGQLNKLQDKSLAAFHALGGLDGLEQGLRTDLHAGLSVDERSLEGTVDFQQVAPPLYNRKASVHNPHPQEISTSVPAVDDAPFADRIRVFKQNKLPARKTAGFLKLFWIAYNDKIIILLTIAAIVSLSLGIYETVSDGSGVDWVEGVAICVAILIVTVVTAVNDWQKEKQFAKLNKRVCIRELLKYEIIANMFLNYRIMIARSKPLAQGSR